jgi:hypothetical protein
MEGAALLDKAKKRKDYDYILNRVNYYNKLTEDNILLNKDLWEKKAVKVAEQPMTRQKVYYLDTLEYARCFDGNNKWNLLPGDITYVEDIPTIVKSRPIHGENQNSVLLKMDKVRHFIFVKDKLSFAEKKRPGYLQRENSLQGHPCAICREVFRKSSLRYRNHRSD